MAETIPLTEAKAHLSDLVDRTSREHERFVVTRNGRPAAVLMSPDDLESLEETVEILRDRELLESLRRSRTEAAEGKRLRLRDQV
jgi:prevent-host-death family protein